MRNTIFMAAMLLLLGVAAAKGGEQFLRSGSTDAKGHEMRVEIDSIVCRPDLSRVYCRAIGRPNTSQRIDSVSLNGTIRATDIDPIYFERAFQWEEEGVQPLEIDFPPLKKAPGAFYLNFSTPYGAIKASFKK